MKILVYTVFTVAMCHLLAADQFTDLTAWRVGIEEKVATEYTDYGADLERVGAFGKAARVYRLAAKRAKGQAEVAGYAMLCQADATYARGKRFRAAELYKEAINTYPQHIDYGHALNMLRRIAEDFAHGRIRSLFKGFHKGDAIQLYSHVISLAPFGSKAGADMLRLAELQREANKVPEAIETYKLAIKRFPNRETAVRARVELAETLLEKATETRDTYHLAEMTDTYLQRALDADPDNPEAQAIDEALGKLFANYYFHLGEFYSLPEHSRPEVAARYYEMVFEAYPDSEFAPVAARRWAAVTKAETPEIPDEPTRIREKRMLPDPGEVVPGLITGSELPRDTGSPEGTAGDDMKKWLLPIDETRQ